MKRLIPVVVDRVIQQAIAQKLIPIYENIFSNNSYGFRLNRSCHLAIEKALEYLNDGYEWVIDLDIEKYFDTVNHDKLISILRENVNDSHTLHLIRLFLRAGIMDNGLVKASTIGNMKVFMEEYGSWLRHKVRVIIIKQWKKPKTIYTNLNKINNKFRNGFNEEEIFKVANARLGWYKRCSMNVVNFILNPRVLNIKTKERPGLVNPLEYYLSSL